MGGIGVLVQDRFGSFITPREQHGSRRLSLPGCVVATFQLQSCTPTSKLYTPCCCCRVLLLVSTAGLGWLAVGVSGTAELKVWVPEGVSVTVHDALIPDYAKVWQKPGFSAMLPQTAKKAAASKSGAKGSMKGGSSGRSSDSDGE